MRPRSVDECVYRTGVTQDSGHEFAQCELAGQEFRPDHVAVVVPRGACEVCCRSGEPGLDRLNNVVASFVFNVAHEIRGLGGTSACGAERAEEIQTRAGAVLTFDSTATSALHWTEQIDDFQKPSDLIDLTVTSDTLAGHVRRREPFAYLRYGDGEWLSMLGVEGRNGQGHGLFPDTLGRELRATLRYAASLRLTNEHFYMGLHTDWHQSHIRRFLRRSGLARRVRWVGDQLLLTGLRNLSSRRFLEAVREFDGVRLLVGNSTIGPVAKALGCRHVVIPPNQCYLSIDEIEEACRFTGPGLVLGCAGLATECLFVRLHKKNAEGSFIDCGHIFDPLVGIRSRRYLQRDSGGILRWLDEHYSEFASR